MTSKPDTAKEQSNTWTRGGQAKSSDVAATTAKFLMVGQLNESSFSHTSRNGTHFKADRCDFLNGVEVEKPSDISELDLCADFAEFAAYHAVAIRERLNGFSGYDTVSYTISVEAD